MSAQPVSAYATTPQQPQPDFGPRVTGPENLPDAADWSCAMARLVVEAMDGSRPAGQLRRWLALPLHERIRRRGALARQRRQPPRPLQVRCAAVTFPVWGVAEVSLLLSQGGRVRALAMRLDGLDGRWVVTAFELG